MNSFRQWNFCSLPRHKEQLKEETNNNNSCMLQIVHFALLAGVVSNALCYGESKIALSLLACCFCCCYFHLLTCFPTTASCLYLQFINYFVKQFHFLSVFALAVCKNIYRFADCFALVACCSYFRATQCNPFMSVLYISTLRWIQ